MIDDVYIGPIVRGNDTDLGGRDTLTFLQALEVSIQSSHSVLAVLSPKIMESEEGKQAFAKHEKTLIEKMEVLDKILEVYPEFAWKRDNMLRAAGTQRNGKSSSNKPKH